MTQTITLFLGSVREGRQGIKVAKFFQKKLESDGYKVNIVDPKECPFPLLDKLYEDYEEGQAPEFMKKVSNMISKAHGILIISAEYNSSIPPALKNTLDHYFDEYERKPVAIVSYSAGPFGGISAATHLKQLLPRYGMILAPNHFMISKVRDSIDENGTFIDENYNRRVEPFLKEFYWLVEKLN